MTNVTQNGTAADHMIQTFLDEGLAELFQNGTTARINRAYHARLQERLDALDRAALLRDLNVQGYRLHALNGFRPTRYSIAVNGPRRITFEFDGGNAYRVDFVQYH